MTSSIPASCTEIPLWPEGVPNQVPNPPAELVGDELCVSRVHRPTLTRFAVPSARACGTAVIICPGGGYQMLSFLKEGIEYAQWANALGMEAFVLKSRLADYGQPAPLQDVLRAVRLVRSRAAEFGVRAVRIGVMGSSAGGHLAACAGTLYDHPAGRTGAALDAVSARPDFLILAYPVITMEPGVTHAGSRLALLGAQPSPELSALYSVERQVTSATPPTFIMHTQEDAAVPVENAVRFFTALTRVGVPAELHVYEKGEHGAGMRLPQLPLAGWPAAAATWLCGGEKRQASLSAPHGRGA